MGAIANVLALAVSLVMVVVGFRTFIVYSQAYTEIVFGQGGDWNANLAAFWMFLPGMAWGCGLVLVGSVILVILVRRWRSA